MLTELLYKWFGLEPFPCATCEVLRIQLDESNRERRELLNKLLEKDKEVSPPTAQEEFRPIRPQFTPWHVRQQLLEAEDRKKAELLKKKATEIEELEKEVGLNG
jgi:hypothetical protein